MYLKVVCNITCKCSPGKIHKQEFHQNNFMHLINAQEVIDMQHNLIKNAVANGKQFRKTQLEFITSRLAGISKALHDKNLSVCPFNSICKQEES